MPPTPKIVKLVTRRPCRQPAQASAWLLSAVLTVTLAASAAAQVVTEQDAMARLEVLAQQSQELQNELEQLRAETPASFTNLETAPPPAPATGFTWPELQTEMKKLAWTKGDFKIVPYGFINVSTVYESQPTTTGEYALYVDSPSTRRGHVMHIDAKTSRLGLDVTGPLPPLVTDAKLGGKVEIDFQGPYLTRSDGSILFRQAYVDLKNEEYRWLFGQTWEVLSPLYPNCLLYVPAAGGGNLGYRRCQFRGERYCDYGDDFLLTLQGSLNTNIVSDFPRDPLISGNHSGWPVLEARVATTLGERKGPDALPITFGVSGHLGEQTFDFYGPNPEDDVPERTWSVCADVKIPITKRFGMAAEVFHGQNLSAYMGGVLQGVDRNTRRGIRSTGGWIDVWYDWTPELHNHWGYAIDDPLNVDVTVGRNYNQFLFTNVMYDVTKNLMAGIELTVWKTVWVNQAPGESNRIEAVVRYSF